jgi:putative ABC transport system substrate-binding protein
VTVAPSAHAAAVTDRRRFLLGALAGTLGAARGADAQHATPPRIAFLALTPGEDVAFLKPMTERLGELGYVEGRTVAFEYRSAEGRADRLPALAAELVRRRPTVLVTGFGTLAAQAAQGATSTIPIVFMLVGDPVGAGLVANFARPGGNVTGLSGVIELGGKHLQLLQELRPGKQVIGVLVNPQTPFTRLALTQIQSAADATRTRVQILEASTAEDVSRQVDAAVTASAGGLLVVGDPLLFSLRRQIAELAAKARLPAVYQSREWAEAGGLIAYGASRRGISRRAAEYVDKILKGARPADLPVEQPTKFELVINLRTAKALGLTIPPPLLATADEVIE